MPKVQLTLDPPKNEDYRPGEELTGTAYFELDSNRKINSFYLILKGRAQYNSYEGKRMYYKDQKLCDVKQEFVAATDLHQHGHFSFDIHLKIPENVPTSLFESKDCAAWCDANRIFIRYFVILVLDVPRRCNFKDKKQIEIVRNDDMNLTPFIRDNVPFVTNETYQVMTWYLSMHGDIHAKVTLPYGAFVRGEKVPILINLKNESDKKFKKIKVKLNQNVMSVNKKGAVHEARIFNNDVAKTKVNIDEVDGVSEALCEIEVPNNIHFTNAPFCEIVKVVHKLKISVYPDSFFILRFLIEIPVIIGNMPIELSDEEKMKIKSFFAHKQSWESPERTRQPMNMTRVFSEYRKESKRSEVASLIPQFDE